MLREGVLGYGGAAGNSKDGEKGDGGRKEEKTKDEGRRRSRGTYDY